jgi:BirA family transcriptional regulator, biotin operon repressor / biotin---[acetyl-CoA-carboxylase] ligase
MDSLQAAAIALPGVEVRVLQRCTSTNSVLLAEPLGARMVLLAAEEQSAGRGRRGRRWHSVPGGSVTFSLARRIARPARELAALALVSGIATARALRALGLAHVALKWPNDLLVGDAKLGGILVETRMDGAAAIAVIGVGLNVRATEALCGRVRRPIACLEQWLQPLPSRNAVIAHVGAALQEALDVFAARGFTPLREEWEAMHAHAGRWLRVRLGDGSVIAGIADGLAEDGGLMLRTARGLRAVVSGQVVSARRA